MGQKGIDHNREIVCLDCERRFYGPWNRRFCHECQLKRNLVAVKKHNVQAYEKGYRDGLRRAMQIIGALRW